MKQTWKNKWLMLLGGMTLLGGLSGCEDRPEGTVPFPEGEEVTVSLVFGFAEDSNNEAPQRLASTARLNGSPQRLASTARLNGSPLKTGAAAFDVTQAVDAVTRSVPAVPDKLYNLEILQYNRNGNYKAGNSYGTVELGTHLDVTLNVMNDCQLLVMARGNGGAVGSLVNKNLDGTEGVKSVEVSSEVINKIDPSTANAINAMPYVLHLEHVNVVTGTDGKAAIQSPEGSYDTRLLLKRLAARLTVNWNYKVSGYKLKQLLIQSVPLNYSVVDGMESDGTYPLLVSQFTTLEVPVTDANAAQGSCSCWMPANVRGERAAANSELLRIKANAPTGSSFLNFVAVNDADVKKKLDYRVYIGSGPSTDFNIYKNKEYSYAVDFSHTGIPTTDKRVTYIDPIPASENNDNLVATANCFMVSPGGSFCFDPFAFQQGKSVITNAVLKGWCTAGSVGIRSVRLLWQTKENGDLGDAVMGIANSDNDHTNIVDIKARDGSPLTGPATDLGQCLIYCRVAANTSGGSGVIAAYDGANGTGNILWSWHVWVTDYQPDASGTETVLTPENKRKFKLGTSNTVMMDRNLGAYEGAVSIPGTTLERSRTSGFHYQKGRKDPFPSSYTTEKNMPEVYTFALSATSPPKHIMNRYEANGIRAIVPRSISSGATTLQNAYQHPVSISGYTSYSPDENGQWCSEYSNVKWDATKTVHDPCPAGWRIPTEDDLGVLASKNTTISSSTAKSNGGMLLKYDDTENRTYLRFTGYPPLITQLNHVGSEGYINAVGHKCVFRVSARESQISIAKLQDYDAHTTRCVQE
ncbi:DUF4906 domain-containing protein [Bacteroides fragilis]|uniref:DUF4906 domain-containing protein n=1 Tax=Bacteroides fragilis TaxID=817 RepID=UPI0004BC2088